LGDAGHHLKVKLPKRKFRRADTKSAYTYKALPEKY
jgi:hypothetical protein